MPYIKPERRRELDPILEELWKTLEAKSGSLDGMRGDVNYCFTKLLVTMMEYWYTGYAMLSSIHSIPIDVANEFRRRHLEPYEEGKIKENGDVKPLE